MSYTPLIWEWLLVEIFSVFGFIAWLTTLWLIWKNDREEEAKP